MAWCRAFGYHGPWYRRAYELTQIPRHLASLGTETRDPVFVAVRLVVAEHVQTHCPDPTRCRTRRNSSRNRWPSLAKKFVMQWSEDTRLKDIVGAMIEQGFAEKFECTPEKPTQGQAGYARFTRKGVLEGRNP